MSIFKCPGSDLIKNPRAEEIVCPGCGESVEIWSDEAEVACPCCGTLLFREMPSACWEWCGSARECVGPDRYDQLIRGRKRKESDDFKIVYDADQIVNLAERDGAEVEKLYNNLLTEGGRAIINRLFLEKGRHAK